MSTYQYIVSAELNDETIKSIYQNKTKVGEVQRIYTNKLKKLLDQSFGFRYFLMYRATVHNKSYIVKKIFRRGKLWFEGNYDAEKKKTIITYDNWRIGIPELLIMHENIKIKIEKEMELPSRFFEGEIEIANWQAIYNEQEQTFTIELNILEEASIQDPAFYIAISQSTLFIGA